MTIPESSYHSPFLSYANLELPWFGLDDAQSFETNVRQRAGMMAANGWLPGRSIAYRFNAQGFRSDPFDQGPGMLFLGCSMTMGTGLPYEETWPYLVARALDCACWNLGVGGGSNDTMFRLALHHVPALLPKAVVVMSTEPTRLEIVEKDHFAKLLVNGPIPNDYRLFYRRWLDQDANSYLNWMKNILAIEQLCKDSRIPFFRADITDLGTGRGGDRPYKDWARDLAHPGRQTVADFARQLIEQIRD